MKRTRGHFIGILVGFLLSAGCGHVIYADGPYRGKVVDKETKQPIEGAAVVAVWWKETPMIAQAQITFYDAQETLTDREGNFTIPGITGGSVNPLAKIREPVFTIFKPGYAAYGGWVFKPRSVSGNIEVLEQGRQVVYALGRLTTREERLKNLRRVYVRSCLPKELIERQKWPDDSPYCVPEEKISNLTRLKKIEESNLGPAPNTNPPPSKRSR